MTTQRARHALARTARPGVSAVAGTIGRVIAATLAVFVVAVGVAGGEDSEEVGTVTTSRPDSPNFGALVAGDGAAETYAYCIVCHSERLVAQQGLTRQGWEEVIDLMVEEHGMVPLAGPILDRVLGYLSTHYGPDRPNFPLQ